MRRVDSLENILMLGGTGGSRRRGWRDEKAGWHHRLDRHEFGWTPGVGDGQGGLACCDSWGHRESDTTERLNDWTEQLLYVVCLFLPPLSKIRCPSVQFSSVTQSCSPLCNSMDCSTSGFPVLHQLPELAQTHVHWVHDCHPTNLILCHPLLHLPSIISSIRVFSNESGGQSIGVSASASVLPLNI